MNTDKLFYEYFQLAPQALFELFQIEPGCAYRFSSPVLKQSERRMDGLLEPTEPGYPRYYLEIQGYNDQAIYWRHVHQIGLHHAQNIALHGTDWRAVVLFLDQGFDPGIQTLGPLAQGAGAWLMTGVLSDLLKETDSLSTLLTVLRPLVADQQIIENQASAWVKVIQNDQKLDEQTRIRLLELFVMIMIQRFDQMQRKEIERMLKLTPIEQTKVGQELIELGIEQGIEQGLEQGIEQGEMQLLSRLIASKFKISQEAVLARLRPLKRADFEALAEYLLQAQSFAEISAWITAHTPIEGKTNHG